VLALKTKCLTCGTDHHYQQVVFGNKEVQRMNCIPCGQVYIRDNDDENWKLVSRKAQISLWG